MKNLKCAGLLLSTLLLVVVGANVRSGTPGNRPPQTPPFNLNGEWTIEAASDNGLRLLITTSGKAIFIRKGENGSYKSDCPNGGTRDYFVEGTLQGSTFNGNMLRCTRSKQLVDDCHLDPVYQTTFKASFETADLIKGTSFAEGWAYDEKNGHFVNCHRDAHYDANPEFKLNRSCDFSGLDWVRRYPDGKSTEDLTPEFRTKVDRFIAALKTAGATVSIESTNRPLERSYLMHYSWQIAHGMDPTKVPGFVQIPICWVHRDANGNFDLAASKLAAQKMIGPTTQGGYGMAYDAAFTAPDPVSERQFAGNPSRHNLSQAIDMSMTWTGNLTITDGNGKSVTITSTPRNGNENVDLQAVGATYGVYKLASDPPHWSATGH